MKANLSFIYPCHMAVAKKAKAAPSKSKAAKASKNKKVTVKPAAKYAGSKSVTTKTAAKKAAKSKPAKAPVTKAAPKSTSAKSAKASSTKAAPKSGPDKSAKAIPKAAPAKSAKAIPKAAAAPVKAKPVTKSTPAKTVAKPASKPAPVKKEAPKKEVKAASAPAKKVTVIPPASAKKPAAPAKTAPVKAVSPTPAGKAKSEPVKSAPAKQPASKSSAKQPDKKLIVAPKPSDEFPDMDPADAKAKKIMKELEETMDLAKMKPRIKVPTPTRTITRHVNHPPLKLVEPTNTNKQKFSLEFEFRSSPKILFNALSDSSGLAGWFADEVRTKDDQFTFVWEGGESYARLVAIKDMFLVRFQWAEDTDGTYFQFEIKQDELTGEIALVITDFALPGERETNIRLWESQVQNLRMLLGSL
jgi:uncharacterized protein YndB with AHSA1/START domain